MVLLKLGSELANLVRKVPIRPESINKCRLNVNPCPEYLTEKVARNFLLQYILGGCCPYPQVPVSYACA